jgi:hypothetical protein
MIANTQALASFYRERASQYPEPLASAMLKKANELEGASATPHTRQIRDTMPERPALGVRVKALAFCASTLAFAVGVMTYGVAS